jgi:predicted transcriptional regulator
MSVKAMTWVWESDLSGNRKLVLLALADHANDEGQCWPGIMRIAKKCGLARSTVIEHIRVLAKAGIIEKEHKCDANGYRRNNYYTLNLSLDPKNLSRKFLHRSESDQSPNDSPSNVQILDGNNINHQEPSIKPSRDIERDKQVSEIFEHWQRVMQKPRAKLDNKRKASILKALRMGYSIVLIKQAIDGCAASAFHMGRNRDNKRHNDITLILRDASHIESFIDTVSNESSDITQQNFNNGNYQMITKGAL